MAAPRPTRSTSGYRRITWRQRPNGITAAPGPACAAMATTRTTRRGRTADYERSSYDEPHDRFLTGPVVHLHPHLLRHAAATHNYERGMTLWEVQKLLGHDRPTTTVSYLNSQELHQTGEEAAGQQLARLPGRRSGRPDARILTWEDLAVIPSDEERGVPSAAWWRPAAGYRHLLVTGRVVPRLDRGDADFTRVRRTRR
jgi:hypothetical protein